MNKFYDLYNDIEKENIYISTMRYMIIKKLKFKDIKGFVNQKVYGTLIAKKAPVREEDMDLQKSMTRIMCKIDDKEEIRKLMNKLTHYL